MGIRKLPCILTWLAIFSANCRKCMQSTKTGNSRHISRTFATQKKIKPKQTYRKTEHRIKKNKRYDANEYIHNFAEINDNVFINGKCRQLYFVGFVLFVWNQMHTQSFFFFFFVSKTRYVTIKHSNIRILHWKETYNFVWTP